ncbi:MAG TPA: hypothetical protein VGG02_11015 [Chthoniobacterales bacterium]|jgi:flagellar basal body-associated protein FliL
MEAQKLARDAKLRWFLSEYVIVVLGVITALAAQQSVEWLHHYHSRRQLEKDLRAEIRLNDPYLREDIKKVYADYEWAVRESQAIQAAVQTNAIATLKYESESKFPFVIPRRSVWDHARESGALALMPRDEAQAYTVVYHNLDVLEDRIGKLFASMGEEEAFEIRFGQGAEGLKDVAKMTPAQLEELSAIIAGEASSARWVLTSLGRMSSMQAVIEGGSFSQEEMLKAYSDSRNPVRKLLQAESVAPPEQERPREGKRSQ